MPLTRDFTETAIKLCKDPEHRILLIETAIESIEDQDYVEASWMLKDLLAYERAQFEESEAANETD